MSSTSSTLNSVLSALGGSGGFDVASTVSNILYADRAPERGWQAQQATLASQTTAINQLQSQSSTLTDDLNALQDPTGAFSSISATSSNSNAVTASAVFGTAVGSHVVTVQSLATTASWYSSTQASSSTPLSAGSFNITSGGNTTTVNVASGTTLDQLAAQVSALGLGVNASVINDSSGARLSLVASTSGSAANFTVTPGTGLTFTQPPGGIGADASLTVDGVPLTSASNTLTGAVAGLTLNLQAVSANPVTISLAPDSAAITQTITSFVNDYNTLIANVNSQFAYNAGTSTAGVLASDSTIQGLQSQLLGSTNYAASGGTFTSLSSLGITTNQDGTLSLNTSTLNSAIQSNAAGVATFFQGAASNGFAASVSAGLATYTDPTEGAFKVDLSSISSENADLSAQTATLELYLASQQTLLTTEYNNADIAIQQLPGKLKQINALLNPNSTNSTS